MPLLENHIAVVTGAASGIGRAIAAGYAGEGARVVLTDVDEAAGTAVAAEIVAAGGTARFLHQDVSDESAWPAVIEAIEDAHGRLDIAVANAGIAVFGPVVAMSLADFRRQNAVNLDGVFLTAKHTIPAMRRCGGGSLILMSSVAGLRGAPNLAGYSASKGAVRLFAKSVAMECAAAGDRIRAALAENPIEPPSIKDLTSLPTDQKALKFLIDIGDAIQLDDKAVLLSSAFADAKETIRQAIEQRGRVTASELREIIGTTRRILIPLLERLDKDGFTRRDGDYRTLGRSA